MTIEELWRAHGYPRLLLRYPMIHLTTLVVFWDEVALDVNTLEYDPPPVDDLASNALRHEVANLVRLTRRERVSALALAAGLWSPGT